MGRRSNRYDKSPRTPSRRCRRCLGSNRVLCLLPCGARDRPRPAPAPHDDVYAKKSVTPGRTRRSAATTGGRRCVRHCGVRKSRGRPPAAAEHHGQAATPHNLWSPGADALIRGAERPTPTHGRTRDKNVTSAGVRLGTAPGPAAQPTVAPTFVPTGVPPSRPPSRPPSCPLASRRPAPCSLRLRPRPRCLRPRDRPSTD